MSTAMATRHPRFSFFVHREMKRRQRARLDFRRGAIAAIDRLYFKDLPPIVSDDELRESASIRKAFEATMQSPMAINLPFPEHAEYEDSDQWEVAWKIAGVACCVVIGILWLASQP